MIGRGLVCALAGIGLSAISAAACDVSIMSVEPCDDAGNLSIPRLGVPYYSILVKWSVAGTAAQNYTIHLKLGNQTYVFRNINALSAGVGYRAYTSFAFPVEGPIPISATIDPEGVTGDTTPGNNTVATTFSPILPATPVEYFGTRKLAAVNSMAVTPRSTGVSLLRMVLGEPTSDTGQVISGLSVSSGSKRYVCAPYSQPVNYLDVTNPVLGTTYSFQQTFTTTASNSRVNWGAKSVTWKDLVPLRGSVYLKPSKLIECQHEDIGAFVAKALGGDAVKMSPVAAARKLFQAVVAELTSVDSGGGTTAVDVLRVKKGDCGGFAVLYIACLRRIGIPARPVQGWREGTNSWHGWVQMYLPGFGWIDQDPNDGDKVAPDGSYAAFFSTMPDLNARVVTGRVESAILPPAWDLGAIQIGTYTYTASSAARFDATFYSSLTVIPP